MAEREHDEMTPGCSRCNDASGETPEVCGCIEDGYEEALRRWEKACTCCFSSAHPEGLEAAVAAARG